jgi:hypothetical protein
MEWVVVGVVVAILLVVAVITRRRRLEAEAHARGTKGDESPRDRD